MAGDRANPGADRAAPRVSTRRDHCGLRPRLSRLPPFGIRLARASTRPRRLVGRGRATALYAGDETLAFKPQASSPRCSEWQGPPSSMCSSRLNIATAGKKRLARTSEGTHNAIQAGNVCTREAEVF
jgi:hypothetical protein